MVFLDAMEAAGIFRAEAIAHLLGSGEGIRFRCDGDAPGERNGMAWLYLDGWPCGGWQYRGLGISGVWSLPQPKVAPARGRCASKANDKGADHSAQAKD